MTAAILNGVSKKTRTAFLNGLIAENTLIREYNRNKKEVDAFSIFGYRIQDLIAVNRATHNPLLKARLLQAIQAIRDRREKGNEQNKLSLVKLQRFKESALDIGLRSVIRRMRKFCKNNHSDEARLILALLEIEFANLTAKMPHLEKPIRAKIYERKSNLIKNIQPLIEQCGWHYGYNDANGKNACYVIYVYLPNGEQLCWHTNDYYIYRYYPPIDAEWDGQICMTMEKILAYIEVEYLKII